MLIISSVQNISVHACVLHAIPVQLDAILAALASCDGRLEELLAQCRASRCLPQVFGHRLPECVIVHGVPQPVEEA